MAHEDIHGLAQRWLAQALADLEEDLSQDGYVGEEGLSLALPQILEETEADTLTNNFSRVRQEVDTLLEDEGVKDLPKEAYRQLCREVLKAKQTYLREAMEREEGRYKDNGYRTALRNEAGSIVSSTNIERLSNITPKKTPPGKTISQVLPEYFKEFERRAPATIVSKRHALERLVSIIGDQSLADISHEDIRRFRETLRLLPLNATLRYPGKTVEEVLTLTKDLDLPRISLNTINMQLKKLGHFFNWCKAPSRKYCGDNPASGLQYEDVEDDSYDPYTEEDLKTLLLSPEFQAQKTSKHPERYWLTLIICFSGGRRSEIADLALSDIKTEGGLQYFDVVQDLGRGRRLKNKASRRVIPVHSALVALGLLEYIAERRRMGETLLFPKAVGEAVSTWWARHKKTYKIQGRKTLHSFRSTLITRLHEAGVDGETRRRLLGHSGRDVHETVYLRTPLPVLSQALEKFRLDWLFNVTE